MTAGPDLARPGPASPTHPEKGRTMTASIPHGPADELCQAAAKVREIAAKATPGPWERPLNTRYKHIVTAAKPDDEQGQYLDGRPERVGVVQLNIWSDGKHMRKRGGRDLEWIALMSPALAEPLAASLEGQGKRFNNEMGLDAPECPSCDTVPAHNHPVDFFHDGDQNRAGCDRPFTGPEGHRCTCFDDALAIARVINGGAS